MIKNLPIDFVTIDSNKSLSKPLNQEILIKDVKNKSSNPFEELRVSQDCKQMDMSVLKCKLYDIKLAKDKTINSKTAYTTLEKGSYDRNEHFKRRFSLAKTSTNTQNSNKFKNLSLIAQKMPKSISDRAFNCLNKTFS
mmetsp:Transcript_1081/g.956  ORF Transcript_1081/g.956 Transcript_1081/m.956 type:complete len:138 (+) Transcript_1081:995-1408(+)